MKEYQDIETMLQVFNLLYMDFKFWIIVILHLIVLRTFWGVFKPSWDLRLLLIMKL